MFIRRSANESMSDSKSNNQTSWRYDNGTICRCGRSNWRNLADEDERVAIEVKRWDRAIDSFPPNTTLIFDVEVISIT